MTTSIHTRSSSKQRIDLPKSWLNKLEEEFSKDYMRKLRNFLVEESKKNKIIYPKANEIFQAFKLTPLNDTKVVIIGQDPYHGPDQAHGLCFSVRPGIKPPASLRNIFKELRQDLGADIPNHGFLESWALQGVLLINTVLTVEKGKAGSHRKKGWEQFTDKVVSILNKECQHLVFILWGQDAKMKGAGVDRQKHLVLESAHPSPFSAHKFHGNKHFSQCNSYLKKHGFKPINWQLPKEIIQ